MLKKSMLGAGVIAAAMSFATPANAATVATFQDPTSGVENTPPPYLFTYTAAAGAGFTGATVTGGYDSNAAGNPDLTLNILGVDYTAAGFTFPTLTATGNSGLEGVEFVGANPISTVTFFDSSNNALLFIDFDRAFLNSSTIGGADLTASIVNIRPASGADIFLNPEDFSFAFANRSQSILAAEAAADTGGDATINATAAFTSSATVVPEPGSMMLLGTGLFGLARAARRRLNARKQ